MKKIIITIDSLGSGGAERGLVALFKSLDYSKYQVDLLYFCHENEYYKELIPSEVNILPVDFMTELSLSSKGFILKNIKKIRYSSIIFKRLWYGFIKNLNKKSRHRIRVKEWKSVSKYIPSQKEYYDAAIAFNQPIYYIVDKVKANRYIMWQRTEYQRTGSPEWDLPYFEYASNICMLSDEMRDSFLELFPSLSEKTIVFPNIYDIDELLLKSKLDVEFDEYPDAIKIISVGTLRKAKGYDTAILACKRLKDAGYNFKWYVLGSGEEMNEMKSEIKKYGLEDFFILMGNKKNPFQYMSRSDIFVQCSNSEGLSTTVFEAKCLKMPIVVTDAPGMANQINDSVNGFVVPIGNDEKVAGAIMRLIDSYELRNSFSNALQEFVNTMENETDRKLELFDQITGKRSFEWDKQMN